MRAGSVEPTEPHTEAAGVRSRLAAPVTRTPPLVLRPHLRAPAPAGRPPAWTYAPPPPHARATHTRPPAARRRRPTEVSTSAIVTSLYDIERVEVDGRYTRCEAVVVRSKAIGAKRVTIVLTISAQVWQGREEGARCAGSEGGEG